MGRLVRRMIDRRFREALRKAHVNGDGEAVADIWRKVANSQMSVEETLAWAKTVGDWITSADDPSRARTPSGEPVPQGFLPKRNARMSRVARIHAALAATGWAEPSLDSLTDEQHILQLAKKGLRPAATVIWWLIAEGNASQGTREDWLDHVAKGIDTDNQTYKRKHRGDDVLGRLGLSGQALAEDKALIVIACRVMFKFPKVMYSVDPRKYVSELITRLRKMGLLGELDDEERLKWEEFVRRELAKNPPPV
jgi:hypothetical protein